MSLLDTIDIQGVRSIGIGPQNAVVIEFLSPLTIICGPNGSGKTTVIEALKYATTSELPPGKMPTFIHDYRLTGKNRVDASVKLKFKDVRNRACVVTRRMTARAEGAKVLNLLGVPAAILEYVVFCHQEESTWPLDEPKKLKERFDEIFQVSGYVKAMELLKKEMKENKSQLQISQARLPLLIEQQNRKIELHNEYIELKRRYEMAEKEMDDSEATLADLKSRWEDVKGKVTSAAEVERKCETLRTERRVLQEQCNSCMAPDYQGSLDDLKREIDEVSNSAEFLSVERERTRIEQLIGELSSKMHNLQKEKEEADSAVSQLKAIQMLREKLQEEKSAALSAACRMFNLDVNSDFDAQMREFERECNAEFSQFQKNYDKSMAVCQTGIDRASAELARIRSEIGVKDAECARIIESVRNINAQLGDADSSQQEMESMGVEITVLEDELKRVGSDMEAKGKVVKMKEDRDEIASKINGLQNECKERQSQEEVEGELRRATDEESRLEGELKELAARHHDPLKEMFGDEDVGYPIGDRLSVLVRKLERTATLADEECQDREKKQIAAQNRLDQISKDIEQTTQQISTHKRSISKVVSSGEDAETNLTEVSALLTKARRDLGLMDGCRYLYEKWEEEVREKGCCPLCERAYESTQGATQLATKVSKKRDELPDEIERLQRRVREYEETRNELIEVMPYVKIVKKLTNDKEELESDLKVAEKKLRAIEEEVKNARQHREKTLKKREAFRSVQSDASLIDKTWNSLSEKRREIKRLKAEMDVCESTVRRPLSELRAELERCQAEYKSVIQSIDEAQASMSYRNETVEKLNALRERRVSLIEKTRRRERVVESLKENQNNYDERCREVQLLNGKLPAVEAELQGKLVEREKIQMNSKMEENRLIEKRRAIETTRAQIESIRKRIEGSEDGATELRLRENRLSELKSEMKIVDEKIRTLNGEFDNVNTKQERKRRLDEQLKKMELAERIATLDKKLDELRWEGKPLDELVKEEQMMQQAYSETSLELERTRGEMGQQKKRIAEMKEKLCSRDFVKSEEDFKKEVITKCVTEKVIEDLSLYVRAVDESIVEFHAKKMEEINEILASLWEKVYRGCDIDKIQIKSESVDEKEKRKSYNYRVVMFTDGKEIDMPGRCSAGQKMLASILIRIALSDVFCDKCSIIALDEPTTNLDVLKVENLGDILAEIIEERSVSIQKAFQLIVITHDYRFVEHLRQLCRPEWVYSLTKDTDATLDRTQEVAVTPRLQPTEASDRNTSLKATQQTSTVDGFKKKTEIRRFLDKFITKLLLAPSEGMPDKLALPELKELCLRCRELFLGESPLLLVSPPVYILGDLHGQFTDLVSMLTKLGTPPRCKYLFLGDYVDRGNWSLETVSLLMAYKLRYPRQVFMLRGNHETRAVNRVYGFFEECSRRFPIHGEGTQLWTLYQHVFNCLPLAAVVGDRIFAAHGGISEDLKCWRQFARIRRPTDITDIGLINDLIWSDPCDACDRYAESPRGVSQVFGKVAIDEFEDALKIDLIVRGHQVVMDGYEFFHNKRCLTIFSAPCYCGEMNNIAGILFVSAKLECAIFTYRSSNRVPDEEENQQNEENKGDRGGSNKKMIEGCEKPKSDSKERAIGNPNEKNLTSDKIESQTLNKKEDTMYKGVKVTKESIEKKETPNVKDKTEQNGDESPQHKPTPKSSRSSQNAMINEKRESKMEDLKMTDGGSKTGIESNDGIRQTDQTDDKDEMRNDERQTAKDSGKKHTSRRSSKKEKISNRDVENDRAEKKEKNRAPESNRSKTGMAEANPSENKGSVKEKGKSQISSNQKKVNDSQIKTVKTQVPIKVDEEDEKQKERRVQQEVTTRKPSESTRRF